MKIFLKQDVEGVGRAQEVHEVADGYARNYLIPQGLAVRATPGRIKEARQYAQSEERRQIILREKAEAMAAKLEGEVLEFKVKAGETGRLYGSVTTGDIAERVEVILGSEFDKRAVELERPIREVGEYDVVLALDGGVRGKVKVVVDAES